MLQLCHQIRLSFQLKSFMAGRWLQTEETWCWSNKDSWIWFVICSDYSHKQRQNFAHLDPASSHLRRSCFTQFGIISTDLLRLNQALNSDLLNRSAATDPEGRGLVPASVYVWWSVGLYSAWQWSSVSHLFVFWLVIRGVCVCVCMSTLHLRRSKKALGTSAWHHNTTLILLTGVWWHYIPQKP